MGIKDITDGDKIARATGARFIESKTGTMGFEVAFRFEEPATKTFETITWVGWLSAGALKYTMETLVNVLGYNGSEDTDVNGNLVGKIFADRDCKLVIENEESEKDGVPTGNYYPKVKYVNGLGGNGFAGVSVQVVKTKLASLGFKGAFLALQQASGKPLEAKLQQQQKSLLTDADIPF